MTKITIDVKSKTIQTLIEEVKSGKFVLPSFQRQYVWDEDDIRDLIDSIINHYPIGTIILWKPSNVDNEIDPFSKPIIDVNQKPREIFYVIDGQQRLTSLLLVFNGWKIARDGEEIKCEIPISYHPTTKKLYKSTSRGIDLSKLVKAFCLQDINTLTELAQNIPREQLEEIKEKIRRILDYAIPIYIMETHDENEDTFKSMAEAFIRVNKYGVRIGNLELMLSFLAGAISGELKKKIRDLYEDLYDKFEIDLQPVIRFTFSNFGLKQTQISKVEQFKRNINRISGHSEGKMREIFDKCNKAMDLTIKFLEKELGITNSRLLPSQTPLIPISAYFYHKNIHSLDELDSVDIKNIVNWFVLVSFNGYYSSQTDTKLDKDLEVIRKSTHLPWNKLLENMQNRKAKVKITLDDVKKGLSLNVLRSQGRSYLFLLYTILVKKGADDWNGMLLNRRKLIELARHHIFPREYLEQNLNPEDQDTKEILINNLANITFIHKDINSEIEDRPPYEYLNDYINAAKNHFIPTDNNLWKIEQYTTFLEYRIRQIYLAGKEIFGCIFE
ncbi:GmrSD restriction endonuclease domain-containing protein [Persephonella sp.]